MAKAQKSIPWMSMAGGFDTLSPSHQASARRSYDRWKAKQSDDGQPLGEVYSLEDYVAYVQGQRNEGRGWRFERPDDRNSIRSKQRPDEDQAPRRVDDFPDDEGWTRATRFRARLLAGHYHLDEALLTPEQLRNIKHVKVDRNRGVATIELVSGDRFEDFGDRIVSARDPSPETAGEIARAAQMHGWSSVQLTGTDAYRDEVALALGLLEPPVAHDWTLSQEAQERLAAALSARSAAEQSVNAIKPVETPVNAVQAADAPEAAGPEPEEAPEEAAGPVLEEVATPREVVEPEPESLTYALFDIGHGERATLDEMLADSYGEDYEELMSVIRAHSYVVVTPEEYAAFIKERAEAQARYDAEVEAELIADEEQKARTGRTPADFRRAVEEEERRNENRPSHPDNQHRNPGPGRSTDAPGSDMAHASPDGARLDEQRASNHRPGDRSTDSRPGAGDASAKPTLVGEALRAARRKQFDKTKEELEDRYVKLVNANVSEKDPEYQYIRGHIVAWRAAEEALNAKDPAALAALERGDIRALLSAGDDYSLKLNYEQRQAELGVPKQKQKQKQGAALPSPD